MTSLPLPPSSPLRRRWIRAGMMALALALGTTACSQAGADPDRVSLEEARAAVESGRVVLFDVRETDEHLATGVASGARLLPTSVIQQRWSEIPTDPSKPVLIICNTQNRSSRVVQALRKQGAQYNHVRYVQGGMSEWVGRGWPVVPASR